jgi:hypothetical protein
MLGDFTHLLVGLYVVTKLLTLALVEISFGSDG